MKIIWDETSFIPYGEGKKVMHKGVKYADRDAAQVPTSIPSKTSWSDLVVPTDNVYYKQGYYSQYVSNPGGWETHDLWLTADYNKPETVSGLRQKGSKDLKPHERFVLNVTGEYGLLFALFRHLYAREQI